MPAYDPDPKVQTQGKSLMYVTVTLPSSTGSASLLGTLILAGTDQSTSAAPSTGNYDRIFAVRVDALTGSMSRGGGASSVPIAGTGTWSEPAENAHLLTYVRNGAAATGTPTVVCVLK